MQIPGINCEITLGDLLEEIVPRALAGKASRSANHHLRETPPPRKLKAKP
jgi:hypothetical protein